MGAINQNHEPVNFYSSARPALDTILIPTTWQEMEVGLSGALHRKVDYQLMAVSGLDGTKFNAENGLRGERQDFGKDNNRNFAVTGRLDVHPIENFITSLSLYSGNLAPSESPTAYPEWLRLQRIPILEINLLIVSANLGKMNKLGSPLCTVLETSTN